MLTNALIQLALDTLDCSQKELALRIGVSPTQISKWKKGEYMSADMEAKLRSAAGIDELDPDFVLAAGSVKDAQQWAELLGRLAADAADNAETGYHTDRLEDAEEAPMLQWQTFHVLQAMGVTLPKPFPDELEFGDDDQETDLSAMDERMKAVHSNPYAALIAAIYKSYTDVYGFYVAYVSDLIDDLDLHGGPASEIEPCLLALAASKLDPEPDLATSFGAFKHKINKEYIEWLNHVKEAAFRAGVPLQAELLDLVHGSHDALGHEAEASSLGFNASRLHPDIYMNELLVGMRAVHQVLPAIMKKLGIYEEFQLDSSEFSISKGK